MGYQTPWLTIALDAVDAANSHVVSSRAVASLHGTRQWRPGHCLSGPRLDSRERRRPAKNHEKMPNLVDPQAILQRFRGLVEAAKFADDREIVHRDIKPNNATVQDDGTPCLVDFGIYTYDEEVGLTDIPATRTVRYRPQPDLETLQRNTTLLKRHAASITRISKSPNRCHIEADPCASTRPDMPLVRRAQLRPPGLAWR